MRRVWYGGEERIADAHTGQLVDFGPGFGRASSTEWEFEQHPDFDGEPEFVGELDWLARSKPPVRGGGLR